MLFYNYIIIVILLLEVGPLHLIFYLKHPVLTFLVYGPIWPSAVLLRVSTNLNIIITVEKPARCVPLRKNVDAQSIVPSGSLGGTYIGM